MEREIGQVRHSLRNSPLQEIPSGFRLLFLLAAHGVDFPYFRLWQLHKGRYQWRLGAAKLAGNTKAVRYGAGVAHWHDPPTLQQSFDSAARRFLGCITKMCRIVLGVTALLGMPEL